tara:strand:- start:325 stop:714 length:390 start_codon:yes stop_codon:yes gene_type:complete
MSHFAKVRNNLVETVIVAEQDFIDALPSESGVTWIQTSYNTRGGVHYAPNSNTADGGVALRKNYAGIGYTYDLVRDAFYEPKPYPSWILNETSCLWEAPIPIPDNEKFYQWDESKKEWVETDLTADSES